MKHKILITLGVLIHILIFIQSILPGDLSANQSGFIVDVLYPFITNLGISVDVDTFSFIIRKLAHFTEFFLLGVFWYLIYAKYQKHIKLIIITLLHGLFTAIIDETIQLFVDGRSGELRDIVIDFSGVCFAVLVMYFVFTYKDKNKKLK